MVFSRFRKTRWPSFQHMWPGRARLLMQPLIGRHRSPRAREKKTHRSPGHHSCQSRWVCISLSINSRRYTSMPCEMCVIYLQLAQFVLHIKAVKRDRSSCKMYSCKQRYGITVCIRISLFFNWIVLAVCCWACFRYGSILLLCLVWSSTRRHRWWLSLKCFACVCVGCPSGCCVCDRYRFSVSLWGSWDYWHQIGTDSALRVGTSSPWPEN